MISARREAWQGNSVESIADSVECRTDRLGGGDGRDRRPGGGGKPLEAAQPGLAAALDALVEPTSRGDPGSPLRYACKSVRHLAEALRGQGFRVGRQKVSELLAGLGYSLQANSKTRE